jgi:hypothetical protein
MDITPLPDRSLEHEQELCLACGFCCNGTLFDKATLEEEEKENLPEQIRENWFHTEKGNFFRLPCPLFNEKCTIYFGSKSQICSGFRCRLLTDMEMQRLTREDALKIIASAKAQLTEIALDAPAVLGIPAASPFREIHDLLNQPVPEEKENVHKMILKAKCKILEALLSRHFKTEEDFNRMINTARKGAVPC